MNLIIFTGIQASGKSTFYRERFFTTHIRLNLDMLRTRNRESILMRACLEAKQPFVIDNTNPTPVERARYIEPALAAGFSVTGYYFVPDLPSCIARNATRKGKSRVPNIAIHMTQKKLQPLSLSEGFTEIYTVRIDPAVGFIVELDTIQSFSTIETDPSPPN